MILAKVFLRCLAKKLAYCLKHTLFASIYPTGRRKRLFFTMVKKGFYMMASGTVKWFSNQKGFGFICANDGGADIFAHFSTIEMDGYKSLKPGQPVIFEVHQGPKGLHATNIRIHSEEPVEAH
jgi:cold shock protein